MILGYAHLKLLTGPLYHNSLVPGKCRLNLKSMIFTLVSRMNNLTYSCKIALRWISKDLVDDQSALLQVICLVSSDNKPLPGPVLNKVTVAICCSLGHNEFICAVNPGLDIKHLAYVPVGHVVLKIYVPCRIFEVPSQYLYKPCKAYYNAGKISTCLDWKITCPIGHVTTKL